MNLIHKPTLEALHARYNDRCFASPDPIEVVYAYPDPRDQEVVAFIAAMLAYGRVASILNSLRTVLAVLGVHPYATLTQARLPAFDKKLKGFKHRWTGEEDILALFKGLRAVLNKHGSLEACFVAHLRPDEAHIIPALNRWTQELGREASGTLISNPEGGSACKRLHMFLRWMVRKDEIDLGLWTHISPAQIFVPLDTHMFSLCKAMGLTERNQANALAMHDITAGFARISPEDPVRYDFCLTRLGIRKGESKADFLRELGVLQGKR